MSENALLLNRADAAVMSRDYALAARLYTTLLKDKPDDTDMLKRLGDVYIKSGDDKKALDIYKRLLAFEPENADFLLTLGGIFRRVKMYDQSIDVLNKALKAGAKEVQVYYNLGFTYKLQEKFADAIDCFETVVTLNPNDVLAYNHMGSIHESQKDYGAAVQSYKMGLKVDPNHPILHFNLAKTYEASGDIDGAIREYEAALRYKPGWKEAYVGFARLLFKSGRLTEAESVTEQAIKLNDDSARLQSLMGDIYMEQDYYEGAEKRYNKSLKSDPRRIKALLGLAKALEAQGKNAEAIEAIQKAKSIAPESERVAKDSAWVNLSAKKLEAANKEIKTLMEKDQDDVETLDLAGQYYICSDDEKSAEDCFKKIENFDPRYKAHLKNASKRWKQRGNLEKAEVCIKKYLKETAPSNAKAYVAMAQIEEALGNLSAALGGYNKAVGFGDENRVAKASSARLAASIQSDGGEESDDDLDLNAGFDETDSLEIDMGQEEPVEETVEEENESVLTDENFDLDAFGKPSLLDGEPEVDFGDIAETAEKEEAEDEKINDMNLLDDEDMALKDTAPALDNDGALDDEIESALGDVPPEPAMPEEPPAPKEPPVERYEPRDPYPPREPYVPRYAPPAPGIDEELLDQKLERQKRELERKYERKLDELSRENRDLMDKMAEVEDNAQKASDAAEKAWYAAQKAADNAQMIEQATTS